MKYVLDKNEGSWEHQTFLVPIYEETLAEERKYPGPKNDAVEQFRRRAIEELAKSGEQLTNINHKSILVGAIEIVRSIKI